MPTSTASRHPVKAAMLTLLALAAAAWLGHFLYHYWRYNSTDDAYVTGHVHQISSEVDGRVAEVLVHENEVVKAGQPLVKIDALEFDIGAEQAAARLAQAQAAESQTGAASAEAEARISTARSKVAQAEAQLAQAKAQLTLAEITLKRDQSLSTGEDRAVTPAEFDSATAGADAAKATVQAAQANIAAAQSEVTAAEAAKRSVADQTHAAHAAVELARAAGKDAARRLSYVTIKAPADGRIGNKNVEVGNRVQTGQTLMVMVEPEVWVEANFKETQMAQIRVGQPAELSLDAIPGHTFEGKVESFAPATGAQFALLPADNATGNFTKVVQRVPVRVLFSGEALKGFEDRVRPGLSCDVDIDVRHD
jgi:membrane fusion protein (multidrug efflux system)